MWQCIPRHEPTMAGKEPINPSSLVNLTYNLSPIEVLIATRERALIGSARPKSARQHEKAKKGPKRALIELPKRLKNRGNGIKTKKVKNLETHREVARFKRDL